MLLMDYAVVLHSETIYYVYIIIHKLQYYKLIEECITQIVLHKTGVDPDFRYTQRFQIDVDPLIGNIIEKTKEEGILGGVERRKLEEALTAKQESEAKLASLEMKVKEQEMELTDTKRKLSEGIGATISGAIARGPGVVSTSTCTPVIIIF
ncbi:DIAPH1 [Bugula neritina]|uniref:DIAPH1 n=1 Tax=Bugula neritina TaxID=10212 RepID=A0A7J7IUL8_BUGNE|nr:DIAPH1 [Bugula neritina]